jgi:hypothetical protein
MNREWVMFIKALHLLTLQRRSWKLCASPPHGAGQAAAHLQRHRRQQAPQLQWQQQQYARRHFKPQHLQR